MKSSDRARVASAGITLNPPEALGESERFVEFQERLSRVAGIDRPVLIVGERGTGKELAAARLHFLSGRWQKPFVALNCAALAPALLESELFGHEAHAFTGAAARRQGRFEAANDGTLFLDEIGLIPMQVQEKILRVVEYGAFERVGGSELVQVNVRILGATNADLPAMARAGEFKVDLLDRLAFEVLNMPPLRERAGDILLLARHFAARMALELGWNEAPRFSEESEALLERYRWPGNIRELKHAVERAVYRSGGAGEITSIELDPFRQGLGPVTPADRSEDRIAHGASAESPDPSPVCPAFKLGEKPLPDAIRELEIEALRQALQATRFHQGSAAKRLGMTYHQFRSLFRKHRDLIENPTKPSGDSGEADSETG